MAKYAYTGYSCAMMLLSALACAASPVRAVGQAPGQPSTAAVNARLDTLERQALSSNGCDSRTLALLPIAFAGRRSSDPSSAPPPPYPGIVDRLARIYRQTGVCGLRDKVIPLMVFQAERQAAVTFLEGVAQEPTSTAPSPPGATHEIWPLPVSAVGALAALDQPGEVALRRLSAEGAVREPMAREALRRLARQGFREPWR